MTGGNTRAAMEGNSEQEVQSRLASVQVGVWLTVIVSVGCALYALETWDHPNRALILTMIGLGLTSAPLIRAMPLERIVSGPYRDLFFAAWSIADLVLIGTLAGLDGGSSSAYTMLLVLPFLFASLSYPTRWTALVGASAVAAALILSLGVGGGFPFSGFGLFVGDLHRAARRLGGPQSASAAARAHRDCGRPRSQRGVEPASGPSAERGRPVRSARVGGRGHRRARRRGVPDPDRRPRRRLRRRPQAPPGDERASARRRGRHA